MKPLSKTISLVALIAVVLLFAGCENLLQNVDDESSSAGDGEESEDTTPPAGVENLSASSGDGEVTLEWTDPGSEELATIEISWSTDESEEETASVSPDKETYTAESLTNGTEVTFSVTAVDEAGNASQAETVSATPEAPNTDAPAQVSDLSTSTKDGEVTLEWTDPTDSDFDHVKIIWTPEDGDPQPKTVSSGTETTTIGGLTNGTEYSFTVKTVDSENNASSGETVTGSPTKTSVTGVGISSSEVTLTDGESQTLDARVEPEDATNQEVSWTSDDESVVTVTSDGEVTGQTVGNALITVTTDDGGYSDSVSVSVEPVPTEVSGIVNSNETWGSPGIYELTGDVELAYGATITVEAGAEIRGNNHRIRVWGDFTIQGTTDQEVSVSNTHIVPEGETGEPFSIDIEGAAFSGGSVSDLQKAGDWEGTFRLVASILEGTPQLYVSSPTGSTLISKNYFKDSGGIYFSAFSSPQLTIENNLFEQAPGTTAFIIRDITGGAPIQVQYNTFARTDETAIGFSSLGSDAPDLDVTQNYWSTTNTQTIDDMIYDRNDTLDNPMVIDYGPILTSPHEATPPGE